MLSGDNLLSGQQRRIRVKAKVETNLARKPQDKLSFFLCLYVDLVWWFVSGSACCREMANFRHGVIQRLIQSGDLLPEILPFL